MNDISAKRWEKTDDPNKCRPDDALHAALRFIEENEMPDHVVVIFGRRTSNDVDGTKFFQAGSYHFHAQMGLLFEGQQMIRETGIV